MRTNREKQFPSNFSIDLQHQLCAQGYSVSFTSKSLYQMKMDVNRVARLVQKTEADVWIIIAGSQDVLRTRAKINWTDRLRYPKYFAC